jgi:antitoxin component YwqK of YwqJK toxin-antitoxin module
MKNYRSSIPKTAEERIVSTDPTSALKDEADYFVNAALVGVRYFEQNGQPYIERPMRGGRLHGTLYYFENGVVISADPYSGGLAHGVSRQWSQDGELLGSFRMERGTGFRFWWRGKTWRNKVTYLAEVRFLKDGKLHGFEWWLNPDQKTICQEDHLWKMRLHGVRRRWNSKGHLERGYPQYWVNNKRVNKRQYLRSCLKDSNLPSFHKPDNQPLRKFPDEVVAAINRSLTK